MEKRKESPKSQFVEVLRKELENEAETLARKFEQVAKVKEEVKSGKRDRALLSTLNFTKKEHFSKELVAFWLVGPTLSLFGRVLYGLVLLA